MVDMSIRLGKLHLRGPVMTASGTFGYGEEYAGLIAPEHLGAVVTKGISLQPSPGNPPPRIVETPSGMLNAIGLQNVGLECFIAEKMPFLRSFGVPVIVNFFGTTVDEYVELAARLCGVEGIAGLEANISCPNIKQGGISFGTDPRTVRDLIRAVKNACSLPLMVKLSPNVTDIAAVAAAAENGGADALSLVNTLTGMVIDTATCRPVLGNGTGGLSGPAIRPLAVRMVWEVVRAVSIPVVGIGGIMTADDALQFLIAGAKAVQVGTGLFVDPGCVERIHTGIRRYLSGHNRACLAEVCGSLRV